jgi:hypothetical protein
MQAELTKEKTQALKLGREELKRRALAVSGRFRSGLTDLSTDHDRYLEEAFSET